MVIGQKTTPAKITPNSKPENHLQRKPSYARMRAMRIRRASWPTDTSEPNPPRQRERPSLPTLPASAQSSPAPAKPPTCHVSHAGLYQSYTSLSTDIPHFVCPPPFSYYP